MARAVREGRTTWAEVAAGKGLDVPVPEIRDLISVSGSRMAEKLAEAEAELAEQEAQNATPAHPRAPEPDEDFEQRPILRKRRT